MHHTIIKFGRWEMASVLLNVLIVKIFLGLPKLMSDKCGSALWLSALITVGLIALFLWLTVRLYGKYEGMDIFGISAAVGGKWLKWFVAVLVVLLLLTKASLTLRLTVEGLGVASPFPIPNVLATALFVLVMIVAAYRGIEGIARMHAVFVPVILGALLFIVLFTSGSFRLTNLFPLWGLGLGNTVKQGFAYTTMYSDLIFLFLLYPYANNRRQFRASAYWGVNLAGGIIVLVSVIFILSMPYPENTDFVMPIYQLSRIIRFGDYSQSLEAVFMPIWMVSSILYLCLSLFFIVRALEAGFGMKYYKLAIVPAAAAVTALAYVPRNMMAAVSLGGMLSLYEAAVGMVLPVALVLVARMLKKTGKEAH